MNNDDQYTQHADQLSSSATHTTHTDTRIQSLSTKRQQRGWTQTDLAVAAGLQPASICRYERGIRPGKRNALRLAAALGCVVEELFPDFDKLRNY